MKVNITKHLLVYSPPVNEDTKKWGVYCIPRMWKEPNGELVVRFNGEQDTPNTTVVNKAPNLYFVSKDNGENWSQIYDGEEKYDLHLFSGWDSIYFEKENGDFIAIRAKCTVPIENIPVKAKYRFPNNSSNIAIYRQGDIPENCIGCELLTFKKDESKPIVTPINFDFPERLISIEAEAVDEIADENSVVSTKITPLKQFVKPHVFSMPYINSVFRLPDGNLGALCFGQSPLVKDHYCMEGYLLCSKDGGITWKKRSTITPNAENYPYGLVGDGGEMSITSAPNGNLLCVTRTDLSFDHKADGTSCGTMLFVSSDGGYSWSNAREIADSSVTPHILTLKNGVIIVIYGRPGVHFIYSTDNGETFSEPISIIGRTLAEEMADGRDYLTCKYIDTPSYSNTFVEVLEDDTVLVLYNNQKYDEGDGQHHKAAFIAKLECLE